MPNLDGGVAVHHLPTPRGVMAASCMCAYCTQAARHSPSSYKLRYQISCWDIAY